MSGFRRSPFFALFFFNDTATTEIYPLSLHDALPISPTPTYLIGTPVTPWIESAAPPRASPSSFVRITPDRKSTRLNSSHVRISYAVFCLKKKKCTTSDPAMHIH